MNIAKTEQNFQNSKACYGIDGAKVNIVSTGERLIALGEILVTKDISLAEINLDNFHKIYESILYEADILSKGLVVLEAFLNDYHESRPKNV